MEQNMHDTAAHNSGNTSANNSSNTAQQTGTQDQPGVDASAQNSQDFTEELNRLGAKVAEMLRGAWESDERKKLEKDLKAGLSSLASGLEQGLKKVGESEPAREFVGKAEDMAGSIGEKMRTGKISADLANGLATGLRFLADQVEKLAAELRRTQSATEQATSATPPASPNDAQEIKIEHK